jgi:hypothetical protein
MSHIQNPVDGTAFTAHLGIGCRFAQESTKQSEGSQTGSISTSSGLHRVEQQNSGQVGLENSPSLQRFKDAIESSSGGSSARVRLDPANLEDFASKPVAQTPFVQALNTLLSLVGTGRFPINETQLSDFTHDCTEEEVNAISDALEAASTHYDKTYGLKDQDGNLQRNEQKEICFKDDAPPRHQIFRQALELLLKEPKASDAESVLVSQSRRTANPLPSVAVSLTDEADAVSPPVKKKPGAWERNKQANLYIETYNQAIESLIGLLKKDSNSLANLKDSIPVEIKYIDRLLIADTIDTYTSEGVDKVIEKLRGLKRENKSILASSNKKVAKWFAKPIVDWGNPEYGLKGSGFTGKTKDLFKLGAFKNISEFARQSFTKNWFSKKVQKYIQDESHALRWRTCAAIVAFIGTVGTAVFTLSIRAGIVALAAVAQFALWVVAGVAGVAISILTIGISCIPLIGQIFAIYLYDRFCAQPKHDAMRAESETRHNQLLAEISTLKKHRGVVEVADGASVHSNVGEDGASVNSTVSSASEAESILSGVADNASVHSNDDEGGAQEF